MNLKYSLLAAALFAAGATSAFAQSTGDVSIIGTLNPGSCTVTLSNAGLADFGTIPAASLGGGSTPTNLPPVTLAATFACSAPTRFAMTATDNREATIPSVASGSAYAFGLGLTAGGVPIGIFTIDMNTPIVDGSASTVLRSTNLGSWGTAGGLGWDRVGASGAWAYRGFGATATGPVALTNASVNMRVTPNIQGRSNLALSQDAILDGSATIELTYP